MDVPVGLSFTPFETRADVVVRLAQRAELLGLDHVGVAEGWTYDATVVATEIAVQTTRIGVRTGVLSVWSRTPAAIALAAATLQRACNGRFGLGLGASSPALVEGFHGIAWERPTERLAGSIRVVRALLDGHRLPEPAGAARSLRLGSPPGERVPIHVAALAPASIRVAGELADGWLPFLWARSRLAEGRAVLAEGERRPGAAPGTEVIPAVPVALGPDERGARVLAQRWLSTYATVMGPIYPRLLRERFGMGAALDAVLEASGAGAAPELPAAAEELAREVTVFGTFDDAAAEIGAWVDAGADAVSLVMPLGCEEDELSAILDAVQERRENPTRHGRHAPGRAPAGEAG